jgi:hypothetical protein
MSVRFDTAADALIRDTGLHTFPTAHTWMMWIYVVSDLDDYQTIHCFHAPDTSLDDGYTYLAIDPDMRVYHEYSGAGGESVGSALSTGQWVHIAVTRTSVDASVYVNGVTPPDPWGANGNVFTATRLRIGNENGFARFNGRVAAYKEWAATLSQSEIEDEMESWDAVRTSDLVAVVYLSTHTDLNDQSGNGNHFSATGTLTTEADPPALPPLGGGDGRTTFNTRSHPLGVARGFAWRVVH